MHQPHLLFDWATRSYCRFSSFIRDVRTKL